METKIFERWLIECGISKLTGEFLNEEAIRHLEEEEEESYVRSKEIVDLCEKWGLFRSEKIDAERVRAWLDQFEYKSEQRLMFKLIENVRFYKEVESRERIQALQESVDQYFAQRGVSLSRPADRRTRRGDILLSSFGSIGKSGSVYARMYSQENNIYADNVVNIDDIQGAVQKNKQIKAIIFVDDIIASGKSAIDHLKYFNTEYGTTIKETDITVFIFAICGLQSGIDALENFIKKEVPFKTEVKAIDLLSESDQCFSLQSKIFSSTKERDQAKYIAEQYGKNLIGNDLSAITIANLLWYFLTIVLITPFPFYGKDQKGGDHYLNEDREHDLLIPVYPSVAYRCVSCQQGLYVCEETVDQDLLHQVVHSVVLKCHTFARGVADCVGRGHSSSRLAMRLASASFNANKGQTTSFGSKPKGKYP